MLIFPKGNNVDNLSMYLDVADAANLPYGWSRFSQFGLAIVNQINSSYSIRKGIFFDLVLLALLLDALHEQVLAKFLVSRS